MSGLAIRAGLVAKALLSKLTVNLL